MTDYYLAESLADSPQPFTFAEVCQISKRYSVAIDRMGVKRSTRSDESTVFRLFVISIALKDRSHLCHRFL